MAIALKELGYDACATASDHAIDAGPQGVARTLDGLDRAGLRHAGTARTAAEATTPTVMDVRGVRVALLSATYGFAGTRPSRRMPWLADRIAPGRILTAARRARRAGARVVIVNLHWGKEYRHPATRRQIALAQRLLASKDIDLIVGQHAHVVQPFGRAINGKLVAYGMGDLVAAPGGGTGGRMGGHGRGRGPNGRNEGIVARFTFTRVKGSWKVTRAEFIPTYIDPGPPLRVVNVTAALDDPRLPATRRRHLQSVLRRTMRTVGSRGAAPILAR
jgi:poly-gamma-glutamate synthesis protein (capsule biosynthesis protein)